MSAMTTIEGITFNDKQWFLEAAFPGLRRCKRDVFKIDQEIFKGKSKFQDIHIFKSRGFGRVLALDRTAVTQTIAPARAHRLVDDLLYLRGLGARLCFTEFPPDRRVLEAGLMFFQPRDFEPGLAGAVRSITRLVRLAESAVPGRWSRAVAGG